MKNLSVVFAVLVFMVFSVPASGMSVDQNSTMVIEFLDGRSPLSIPTDQIRLISFRPTFQGQGEPAVHTPAAAPAPVSGPSQLGRVWKQVEGAWRGTWTRRGNSNTFDAVWTRDNLRVTAVLTIAIDGSNVIVNRRQSSDGDNFDYTGSLSPDGNAVSGTYTVKGNRNNWTATIVPLSSREKD